ncbi:hypothetical protein HY643_02895 [Candidatus Woesearchaeota archaeon]|nr:hypothetical protein [Candidatus Woesearchaeota archaeon]
MARLKKLIRDLIFFTAGIYVGSNGCSKKYVQAIPIETKKEVKIGSLESKLSIENEYKKFDKEAGRIRPVQYGAN